MGLGPKLNKKERRELAGWLSGQVLAKQARGSESDPQHQHKSWRGQRKFGIPVLGGRTSGSQGTLAHPAKTAHKMGQ